MTSGTERLRPDLKFSPEVIRVIETSYREARIRGHAYINTDHILWGIVDDPTTIAARLISAKVGLINVKSAINAVIDVKEKIPNSELGLGSWTKKLLELAIRDSRENDDDIIGTEHLLFAALKDNVGNITEILNSFGFTNKDLPELREKAKELKKEQKDDLGVKQVLVLGDINNALDNYHLDGRVTEILVRAKDLIIALSENSKVKKVS